MIDTDEFELHPIELSCPERFPNPGGGNDACEGHPPFINKKLTREEWFDYVERYDFGPLPPNRLVLHHTWKPTEQSWNGLSTMQGMQNYYRGLGWNSAPHIYCAPDGIWLATPMYDVGIHAGAGNGSVRQGWYSIGLEMVGAFDQERPTGEVWANSLAVMVGLSKALGIEPERLISFHRDYTNQKSCPGWAVTHEWVWGEVRRGLSGTVEKPESYSENSSLIGLPNVSPQQAITWINSKGSVYTPYSVRVIVNSFVHHSTRAYLNWLLVLAQSIHETSQQIDNDPEWEPFSSWWAQRPRRNSSGFGVTGDTALQKPNAPFRMVGGREYATWAHDGTVWRQGISFPSWDVAIQAQVGRLLLYTQGISGNEDQRRLAQFAHNLRPLSPELHGHVRILKHLGAQHHPLNVGKPKEAWKAGWAWPGTTYGQAIARIANAIASS